MPLLHPGEEPIFGNPNLTSATALTVATNGSSTAADVRFASALLHLLNMNAQWQPAARARELSPDRISIWRVYLDREIEHVNSLAETLSSDEKNRAERFHFEHDRNRFVVARATLRRVLATYLQIDPHSVQFHYGVRGKPALNEKYRSDLTFNVSHSHGLALLAMRRSGDIGVDIEKIRHDFEVEKIARRYFSESELHELLAVPKNQRIEAFFLCWTRKEALIKALGEGLHMPLETFGVTLRPNHPAAFTHGVGSEWRMEAFTASEEYPAAVVYDGRARDIEFFEFGPSVAG